MDRPSSYWNRALTFVKQNRFLTFVITVGAFVVAFVIRDLFTVFVRGYAWKAGTGFAGKTLWEWLELLVIPAVLAVGAILFNRAERRSELHIAEEARKTDREIASDRSQDAALQAYLDKMTDLLLEKGLRKSGKESEVTAVARARTLTTLRTLDGTRKGSLLRFLYESDLITRERPIIDLTGAILDGAHLPLAILPKADLSGALLNGADLYGADLSEADLSEADLSEAFLFDADLSDAEIYGADLSLADLSEAILSGADLSEADLRRADLSKAHLSEAHLRRADLSEANLRTANLIEAVLIGADMHGADLSGADLSGAVVQGAIMPDGTVHE
jgi:uncharacterized protein YjbI with pentapeptide repeats